MTRILVTGGAGFIGSVLAEKLILNKDNFVVIVDDLSTGSENKLPHHLPNVNWRFVKADVNEYREIAEVMLGEKFDFVFHYAALVGVQRTQENPVKVLNDIEGFKNILSLSKSTGVNRVFFSSSSEVYGEPVELPQHEQTTPLNSKVPYAVVKNIGEAFLRSYHQEFGLDFTIFRFFNTYGPKQSDDFVMSKFLFKALNGEDITIYGDGSQTRTFCYCDDNVDACLKAFYENKVVNDVINIGGENEIKILDLAHKIISITKSSSKIVHLPALKDGDMTRRCPDNTKMKELLGRDLLGIDEGISRLLASPQFQ
ncbi:NAD-dependent epimerase/dehydratase family protein [Crocinitomicaceae bacterium]|nr:NAD-dependent epimerase/dehydratase family protein [Crocinitomicaceae bacterium]